MTAEAQGKSLNSLAQEALPEKCHGIEERITSPSSGQASIDNLLAMKSPCLPLRGSVGRTEGEELTSLQKSIVKTPFMLRR